MLNGSESPAEKAGFTSGLGLFSTDGPLGPIPRSVRALDSTVRRSMARNSTRTRQAAECGPEAGPEGAQSRLVALSCATARSEEARAMRTASSSSAFALCVVAGLALAHVGAEDGVVDYRLVTETTVRDVPQFAGSPTILVDGHDLFPSEGATADLACRVYVSEGRLAGLPSVGEIVAALRQREMHDAQD